MSKARLDRAWTASLPQGFGIKSSLRSIPTHPIPGFCDPTSVQPLLWVIFSVGIFSGEEVEKWERIHSCPEGTNLEDLGRSGKSFPLWRAEPSQPLEYSHFQ